MTVDITPGRYAHHRAYGETIRAAIGVANNVRPLSKSESLVLTAIASYQPITRGELGQVFGKEVSRDTIGALRSLGFIAAGPRSPQPGAPYTYVTTKAFLSQFGFDTLRDLPDMEALPDAGLSKDKLLAGDDIPMLSGDDGDASAEWGEASADDIDPDASPP
jgi:chromosome segregation and condensation protein ScpB